MKWRSDKRRKLREQVAPMEQEILDQFPKCVYCTVNDATCIDHIAGGASRHNARASVGGEGMNLAELQYELRLAENVRDSISARMGEVQHDIDYWEALNDQRREADAYVIHLENQILEWR